MSRPRLCRACHAQATCVEETDKPAIHIDRYGTRHRLTRMEPTFPLPLNDNTKETR